MTITAEAVTGQPFSFKRFRQALAALGLQEGVYGAGDFLVRQRAAGANMSVEVDPGDALVAIDSGTRNGAAHVMSDAVENPAVGASHATLPRIDCVVLQYNDTGIPAGVGGNTPTVRVVPGTATAGATLDNRNGAPGGAGGPAFPADALLLRDVLVPAASTSVTTANIRDRRRWARGAFTRILRGAADYVTTSGIFSAVDSANLAPRLECSGAPVRVRLSGIAKHSVANDWLALSVQVDGVVPDGATATLAQFVPTTAIAIGSVLLDWTFVPTPGSHVIRPAWATQAATATLSATNPPLLYTVEEIARQNADNT